MDNSQAQIDKALFKSISHGDEAAYATLFNRYVDKLKWYAFKLLNSEFWAEEVVQEVFLYIWELRHQIDGIEQPSAYLYKIASNRCFDRMRRMQLEVDMQYVVSAILHGTEPVTQEGAQDLKKLEALLHEAIAGLPEQRKLIYKLQQEEGLTYQQIADRLQISRHTVRNQLAKTSQTIRSYLLEKDVLLLLIQGQLIIYFIPR